VSVSHGNICTNEFTVFASEEISFVSMTMPPDATSAHAVGRGTVTNLIDGTSLNVFVDVSFVEPTEFYEFSQPPTDGQPVRGTSAVGRYEGSVTVDGLNYLAADGSVDSRATLDRWRYVTP
jgi:hypothetical protein